MVDNKDYIWICSNQEDEIVVIDKTGKVVAKRGDFRGVDQNGIAQGLLFPASLAFSKDGSSLYVSNLTHTRMPIWRSTRNGSFRSRVTRCPSCPP
jgi:sugar lactone lactonase YvrE